MHSHGCAVGRPLAVRAQWNITRRPLGVHTAARVRQSVHHGPSHLQLSHGSLWRSRPSGKFRLARSVRPAATRDSQYPFNGAPWAPQGGMAPTGGVGYSAPPGAKNQGPGRSRPGYVLDARRVRGALPGMRPTVISAGGLASLLDLEQEIEEDLHRDGERHGDLDNKLDELISMAKLAAAKAKKLSSASNSLGHYKYTMGAGPAVGPSAAIGEGPTVALGARPPNGIDPVDRPVDKMRRERQARAAEFLEMTRGAAAALELRAKKVRNGRATSIVQPVETMVLGDDVESVTFSALPERVHLSQGPGSDDSTGIFSASGNMAVGSAHSLSRLPGWVSGSAEDTAGRRDGSLSSAAEDAPMSDDDSPGLRALRAEEDRKRKTINFAEPEDQIENLNHLRSELPPFLSDLVVEADASVPVKKVVRKAVGSSKVEGKTELVSETVSDSGVGDDGLMWWRDSGTERGPNGLLTTWTHIRGVSADGKTEWAERWWNKADWSGLRESGAEKTGADAAGNVWFERWNETFSTNADGVETIEQACEKRASQGATEWEEKWTETHNSFGWCKRDAHKWCKVDNGAHAWNEKWGEEFDGWGGSMKYTDRWSENCDLGRGGKATAKWGDKWKQHFSADGTGHKEGATWGHGEDGGQGWEKFWGEEHNATGYVRKFGGTSDGSERWDHWEKEDTWFEPRPNIDYAEKVRSSQHLLSIEPAAREEEDMEIAEPEEPEGPRLRANLEDGAWPVDLASALALVKDSRDSDVEPVGLEALSLSDIEDQASAAIEKVRAAIKYISPQEIKEEEEEEDDINVFAEADFGFSGRIDDISISDLPTESRSQASTAVDEAASTESRLVEPEALSISDLPVHGDPQEDNVEGAGSSAGSPSADARSASIPLDSLGFRHSHGSKGEAEDERVHEDSETTPRDARPTARKESDQETTSAKASDPPPPPMPLVEAPPPPLPQVNRYGGATVAPAVPEIASVDDAATGARGKRQASAKGNKKSSPGRSSSGFR